MTSKRDKQKQNRSQLYRQIEDAEFEDRRIEMEKKIRLWKSKVFTDIAKLVLAGVVLGGIFEDLSHPFLLFGIGTVVFLMSLFLGYWYYKRGID